MLRILLICLTTLVIATSAILPETAPAAPGGCTSASVAQEGCGTSPAQPHRGGIDKPCVSCTLPALARLPGRVAAPLTLAAAPRGTMPEGRAVRPERRPPRA